MARMRVDERNRQPFGFLSGGASLALAENVAGVGSSALCPGCACVGIEVSGSHVKAVGEGDTVTAYARLLHKGTTLHVWNVDIKDTSGELISNVRVTNYVIKQKLYCQHHPLPSIVCPTQMWQHIYSRRQVSLLNSTPARNSTAGAVSL